MPMYSACTGKGDRQDNPAAPTDLQRDWAAEHFGHRLEQRALAYHWAVDTQTHRIKGLIAQRQH